MAAADVGMESRAWVSRTLSRPTAVTAVVAGSFAPSGGRQGGAAVTAVARDGRLQIYPAGSGADSKATVDVAVSGDPIVALLPVPAAVPGGAGGGDLLFAVKADSSWQLLRVDGNGRDKSTLFVQAQGQVTPPVAADKATLFHRQHLLCIGMPLHQRGEYAVLLGIYDGWLAAVIVAGAEHGQQSDINLSSAHAALPVSGLNCPPRIIAAAAVAGRRCHPLGDPEAGYDPMGNPAVALLYADDDLKVLHLRCVNIDLGVGQLLDGPWGLENVAPIELAQHCAVLGLTGGVLMVSAGEDADVGGRCSATFIRGDGSGIGSAQLACGLDELEGQQLLAVDIGGGGVRRAVLLVGQQPWLLEISDGRQGGQFDFQITTVALPPRPDNGCVPAKYGWLAAAGPGQVVAWCTTGAGLQLDTDTSKPLKEAGTWAKAVALRLSKTPDPPDRSVPSILEAAGGLEEEAPPLALNCSVPFTSLGAGTPASAGTGDPRWGDRALAAGCGVGPAGSLAVYEFGCGLTDFTAGSGPELPGATRLFAVGGGFLVCSYDALRETRVLDVSDPTRWAAVVLPGLAENAPTLAVGRLQGGSSDGLLQVTDAELRLVDSAGAVVERLSAAQVAMLGGGDGGGGGALIGCAAIYGTGLVMVSVGNVLACGEVGFGGLRTGLAEGVFGAAESISAVAADTEITGPKCALVAYSEWRTNRIELLQRSVGAQIKALRGGAVTAPVLVRALQFYRGGGRGGGAAPALLAGLADGVVLACEVSAGSRLEVLHAVRVGQSPVSLTIFGQGPDSVNPFVFCSSKHGLIVTGVPGGGKAGNGGGGLRFDRLRMPAPAISPVELPVCASSTSGSDEVCGEPSNVAWISDPGSGGENQRLLAGRLDPVARARWRSRRVGRTPLMMVEHRGTGLLVVVTEDTERVSPGGGTPAAIAEWPGSVHVLRAYDPNTLELRGQMEFAAGHIVTALHGLDGLDVADEAAFHAGREEPMRSWLSPECMAVGTALVIREGLEVASGSAALTVLRLRTRWAGEPAARHEVDFEMSCSCPVGFGLGGTVGCITPCRGRAGEPAIAVAHGRVISVLTVATERDGGGAFILEPVTDRRLVAGSAASLSYVDGYFLASELQPGLSLFRWHDDHSLPPTLVLVAREPGVLATANAVVPPQPLSLKPGSESVLMSNSVGTGCSRRQRRGLVLWAVVGIATGGVVVLEHAAEGEGEVAEIPADGADADAAGHVPGQSLLIDNPVEMKLVGQSSTGIVAAALHRRPIGIVAVTQPGSPVGAGAGADETLPPYVLVVGESGSVTTITALSVGGRRGDGGGGLLNMDRFS